MGRSLVSIRKDKKRDQNDDELEKIRFPRNAAHYLGSGVARPMGTTVVPADSNASTKNALDNGGFGRAFPAHCDQYGKGFGRL